MKVLGISDSHSEKYICEVSHDELCKLMSKSIYGNDKLEKLKVGDIMNLGAGYDFLQSIRRVCSEMTEASKAFKVSQDSMLNFAALIAEKSDDKAKL